MTKICTQCGKEFECETTRTMCRSCIQKNCVSKKKQTFLKNYGVDNPSKSPYVQQKMTDTFLTKYGVKRPIQNPEIKSKMINTVEEKYGVKYYCQHEEFLSKSTTRVSEIQKRFMKTLDENNIEYDVEFPIESKNFDIHLKHSNILIEINPSYTHSNYLNHWGKGLDKTYHIEKTLVAERNGYRCIHVWDWDNWDKILKLVSRKTLLNARCFNIMYDVDISKFLEENDICFQNSCNIHSASLINSSEILATMIIETNEDNQISMRYISKLDTVVRGGLSKLYKHSVDYFKLNNVKFYCDRSKFTGNSIQSVLGLEFIGTIHPACNWSKNDSVKYNVPEDQSQTLLINGWLPVYDCGQSLYSTDHEYKEKIDTLDHIDYEELMKNIESKKETRYCEFCGKPFHPQSWVQKYCKNIHTRICPVCGKSYVETNNDNLKKPPVACSYACRLEKTRTTNLSKYGTKDYFSSETSKKKSRDTMMRKYGVPYAMMSESIRSKSENSIYNKYGTTNQKIKRIISRESIHRIYYEDDRYIVFQSQDEYLIENIQLCEYVRSVNKIPVVVYLDEDSDKVIGQLDLSTNRRLDSKDLTVYKLTKDATEDFLMSNDYMNVPEGIVLSLGLVKDSVIYQNIVFSKNKHNKNYKLQLIRICNKQGYTIEGGLDKQSSIASMQFEITSCIAYQDQAKSFMNPRFESIGMEFLKQNHGKQIIRGNQTIYDCGTNVYVFG